MDSPWQIEIWGVRGSLPAPGREFLEYGGNTSCISLDWGGGILAFDAGSGLGALGGRMEMQGIRRLDILVSHLHLDHLMGLCAFPPLFDPAAELHLYGPPGLEEGLRRVLGPPCWPLGPRDVKGAVALHTVTAGEPFSLAGELAPALRLSALAGCHPGGSFLYRVESGEKRMVYGLDCEMEGDMAGRLARFAQNARLLVWDASFAPGKAIKGWGHSTWAEGIAVGREARAGAVLMSHYSQGYTDGFLREQEALARRADPRCRFAKEGMVMEL